MLALDRFITPAEAARRAGVTRRTIMAWLDRGLLTPQTRPMDGRVFVDAEELDRKVRPAPAEDESKN